jgi:hypothetical protein
MRSILFHTGTLNINLFIFNAPLIKTSKAWGGGRLPRPTPHLKGGLEGPKAPPDLPTG